VKPRAVAAVAHVKKIAALTGVRVYAADASDVRLGSFASILACPRHV